MFPISVSLASGCFHFSVAYFRVDSMVMVFVCLLSYTLVDKGFSVHLHVVGMLVVGCVAGYAIMSPHPCFIR